MPSTIGPLAGLVITDFGHTSGRYFWVPKTESLLEIEVCSPSLKTALSSGESLLVFIAEVIREDGRTLFGFQSLEERDIFLALKELDSVGNKTAAIVVRELGIKGLRQLMTAGPSSVGKIPGLGPKTLEKIKSGLVSDKVYFESLFTNALKKQTLFKSSTQSVAGETPRWMVNNSPEGESQAETATAEIPVVVVQALTKLGVPSVDIFRLHEKLLSDEGESVNQLTSPELIKKLLSVWSRLRQNKQVRVHEKEGV